MTPTRRGSISAASCNCVSCCALQCVAVFRNVLQCVAVRCSALQRVAVCCSALQCVAVRCNALQYVAVCCSALQCVTVCCRVLQCFAVFCSILCISCDSQLAHREISIRTAPALSATHCNTLQRTATYYNALQHTVTNRGYLVSTKVQHISNTLQHTALHCVTHLVFAKVHHISNDVVEEFVVVTHNHYSCVCKGFKVLSKPSYRGYIQMVRGLVQQ